MTFSGTVRRRLELLTVLGVFLLVVVSSREASAAAITVVREYTYRAGDADSKLTCRAIALEQVKRLLLEELGTFLVSSTEIRDSTLSKDEIVTYSAGAVVTMVIEEHWNGEEYFLKAKITADAGEVAKAIAALHDDREKAAELQQLRAQAGESLKEIERLRKELSEARSSQRPEGAEGVLAKQMEYNGAVARLTAKDYLEQGIRLQKGGTFAEVEDAFAKAIAVAAGWYRPYLARGALYLLANQPQKARLDLEQALRLNAEDPVSGNLHGIVLLRLGRRQEGLAEFKRVAAAAPRDFALYTNIGGVLFKNDLAKEALPFLTHAIGLRADDQGRAAFLRAQVYNRLGKKQEALADLRLSAQQGNVKARELLQ